MSKFIFIFFFFFFIVPVISWAAKLSNQSSTVYTHSLPPFDQIAVQGSGIKLKIIGEQKRRQIEIKGPIHQVNAEVRGKILFVHGEGGTQAAKVTIRANQVVDLQVVGNSFVQARQLGQLPMTVVSDDTGDVNISGVINLRRLIHEGTGNVVIYWVNSPELQLHSSGGGSIKLAGIVKILHARLTGHSNLDAPYLRVRTAFIQTMQNANAKVLALNKLDAFAGGHSNIYYFKAPRHLVAETQAYGNVLQLDYWN